MTLPRLPRQISLNLLLLLFAAQKVCAQLAPADDFFNGGAQLYISNNVPAALEKTESGLKLYPNDEKLQKLEKLLKQQQQSQSSQSQQNQQQQSQNQKQQNQNSSQTQNQRQQDQQKQNQANQNKKQNSQQQSQEKSGEGKHERKNAMTPQEAKQLLDAQKGDEQFLRLKPQGKPQNNSQPIKDW